MTVYVIYITFLIFVILLVLVGIYFMSVLRYQKLQNKRVNKKIEEIKDLVEKHINDLDLDDIPNDEIVYLKTLVNDKIGLQAFYYCYKEYVEKNGFNERLREYAGTIISHDTLMKNRIVRDKYRQSYILFLLAEFGVNTEEVGEFALSSLNKKSIYVRNNALRVIQNSGSIPLVLRALDVIDNGERYFNYRVLVDILDNFKGDKEELRIALLNAIDNYGDRIKRLIVEHFSNNLEDAEEIRLKVLEYFTKLDSKGIVLICTRYFGRVIDSRAKGLIVKNLEHPDWEVRSMSAKVLVNYNDEEVRDKLSESLNDENYFVRYNSAFSYIDMDEVKNLLSNLSTKIRDGLAHETLLYAMQRKNLISYEDYRNMLASLEEGGVTS